MQFYAFWDGRFGSGYGDYEIPRDWKTEPDVYERTLELLVGGFISSL